MKLSQFNQDFVENVVPEESDNLFIVDFSEFNSETLKDQEYIELNPKHFHENVVIEDSNEKIDNLKIFETTFYYYL